MKKEEIRMVNKNEKGVTLIAMIVTIMVLMILAGVSIASLIDNDGIVPKATEAKNATKLASIREVLDMYLADIQMEADMYENYIYVTEADIEAELLRKKVITSEEKSLLTMDGTNGVIEFDGEEVGQAKVEN